MKQITYDTSEEGLIKISVGFEHVTTWALESTEESYIDSALDDFRNIYELGFNHGKAEMTERLEKFEMTAAIMQTQTEANFEDYAESKIEEVKALKKALNDAAELLDELDSETNPIIKLDAYAKAIRELIK